MPNPLQVTKDYGSSRGFHVRTRRLLERPDHWRWAYYGQADLIPDSETPRAEIAWVGEQSADWLAVVLAHELGHCEQMTYAGKITGLAAEVLWQVECDAWERGLRMLGECGIALTPAHAELALHCLLHYYQDGPEPSVVAYLDSVAYA